MTYLKEILRIMPSQVWRKIVIEILLTHEFAVCPKYLARPVRLIDKDPKASTMSGLVSSSLTITELGGFV